MTDHANELRRHARKIGHPAGDVPAVMAAAADWIEHLQAKSEAAEKERDNANAAAVDIALREEVMNPTETVSRLRRLVNDWRKEEKQLCELFMDEIIPHSLRARRIKDAQAIDAAVEMIERMGKIEAALQIAMRQNSHDMLMTGDELRQCEAAMEKSK